MNWSFAEKADKGKDIANFPQRKNSIPFSVGTYLTRVVCAKGITDAAGKDRFVAEFKVVDSAGGGNPIGSEPSIAPEIPGPFEYGMKDANAFLTAAYHSLTLVKGDEFPEGFTITKEMADYAMSTDNPLKGVFLIVRAYLKKPGDTFAAISYTVPPNAKALYDGESAPKL